MKELMKQKLYKLLYSAGLWQSATTLAGSTMATAISAVALMIYSRALGPEQFGEFSVGFALTMILVRINDFGTSTAILKFGAQKATNQSTLFFLTLKYKALFSLIIIAASLVGAEWLAGIFNLRNPTIILVAGTLGLSAVYYEQLLNTLQSLHRFNQAITVNIIQALAKIVWAAGMLLTSGGSATATFAWYVAAPIVPVFFIRSYLNDVIAPKLVEQNETFKNKVVKLSAHSAVGLISMGIIDNIDVLYLQRHLTAYEVGLYGGVSRISLLFGLIAYSLGTVLYPRVAQYKSREVLRSYLKKAGLILLATIAGFICFIPLGKLAILLTIGPEYIAGLSVLYILVGAACISIASVPFAALFFSFTADWYFSIGGVLQLIIILVANAYFIPLYGLEAAAWARLGTKLVFFFFTISVGYILYNRLPIRHNS